MTEAVWTTVFQGPPGTVDVLRARLGAEGIETFVPDELTKMVDPFMAGPDPFGRTLQVPAADAARAAAVLADHPTVGARGAGEAGEEDEAGTGHEADAADGVPDPLDAQAMRTILLAVLLVTAPLALLSGAAYLWACRKQGRRARLHGAVLLALGLSVVLVGAAAVHVLTPEREAWRRVRDLPVPSVPHHLGR